MLMTTNEPNNQIHVPWINIPARISYMQPITGKIVMLNLLIYTSPLFLSLSFSCPFPSFAYLLSFLKIQVNVKVLKEFSKCARV